MTRPQDELSAAELKRRLTWAALIKLVFEVDPLQCPNCGGTMRIVSFIENSRQHEVVEKVLRHCGLWKDTPKRGPPRAAPAQPSPEPDQLVYDDSFFDRQCA